jgi:hypothetical protein
VREQRFEACFVALRERVHGVVEGVEHGGVGVAEIHHVKLTFEGIVLIEFGSTFQRPKVTH